MRPPRGSLLSKARTFAVIAVAAAALTAQKPAPRPLSGQVLNAAGIPVAGATVQLVPTGAIDMTPITASAVYSPPYPAEAYDEPLEDAIRLKGATFPRAATDSKGRFSLAVPDGSFFVHVTPAAGDPEHLPGGDKSRSAYKAQQLRGTAMTIKVSSRPPQDATFVGSTSCLTCHKTLETWKQTGHKLAWTVPGAPAPSQDHSRLPDMLKVLPKFKEAEDYTKGTRLELGDMDPRRSSDPFKVREFGDARLPIETVFADLSLWKSKGDSKHYISIANRLNPQDPNSPSHLEVKLLYGGAVHRQRFIVSVPPNLGERQGWYVVLQFNPDGRDERLNRERRVWRDFYLKLFWGAGKDEKYGTGDDVIKAPPVNDQAIQTMCAACHVTGYERYRDARTGQFLVRAVKDPRGELNLDGAPGNNEINIGCEVCHGPGSKHSEANTARYTVNPKYLSAERSTVVCGRCHDRRQGVGGPIYGYTQPINAEGKVMMPGESRHTLLTEYTDPKKKGPVPGQEIWPDDIHSRSPHQQYPDFYKSKMYKNQRLLVSCADCHNMHGDTPYRRWLIHNPDDPSSPLCQRCHGVDLLAHMETKLGAKMKALGVTRCVDCHMPGTMIAGGDAGAYGRLIKTPPYKDAAEEEKSAYWEGNINSHTLKVPLKTNVGVRGVTPGRAMPIPYTNSCGTCHVVNELPFK